MNLSLDGEDVCVCVGCCADDALPHWAGKVALSGATMVVCLYDSNRSMGKSGVERFAQMLKQNLPAVDVCRCILVMSADEWGRVHATHREEAFSIVHFHIDSSMALPSSADDTKPRTISESWSGFDDIPQMQEHLMRVVDVFEKSPCEGMWPSVLLLGETGSGKTYAAQRIYKALVESGAVKPKRNEGQFVALNCGEFGREDINAALFGVKGGAFTGVPKDRPGAIAKAKGGVLFLDEIGTLPMELQPRLLTVLDGGKYRIHGEAEPTGEAKCRFVFGTNEDLVQAIREGRFRFDLYNRISGIEVRMPSVKERIDGSGGRVFLDRRVEELCRLQGGLRLTNHARALFLKFARQHPWRGNFRELIRCFRILAMKSNQRKVVSASTMANVINEIARRAQGEEAFRQSSRSPVAQEHPLLKDRAGLGANEKVLLAFAFKCAEAARTRRDAGRRFYEGKCASVHFNWGDSFVKYIARFGFGWRDDAPGHIVSVEKHND